MHLDEYLKQDEEILWSGQSVSQKKFFKNNSSLSTLFILLGIAIFIIAVLANEYNYIFLIIFFSPFISGLAYYIFKSLKQDKSTIYYITDKRIIISSKNGLSFNSTYYVNLISLKYDINEYSIGSIYYFTKSKSNLTSKSFLSTSPCINNIQDVKNVYDLIIKQMEIQQ